MERVASPLTDLFRQALRIGIARFKDSQSRHDRAGAKKSLRDDLMGALAEAYLAEVAGESWNASVREFRGQLPDVGTDLEARFTHHQKGRLIFRPGETLDRRYALIVGAYPHAWSEVSLPLKKPEPIHFRFPGWLFGYEIAIDPWKIALDPGRPPCWAAPQSALNRWEREAVEEVQVRDYLCEACQDHYRMMGRAVCIFCLHLSKES